MHHHSRQKREADRSEARLWDLECQWIDMILCTVFDAYELRSLLPADLPDADPSHPTPEHLAWFGIAHHFCHSDNRVSRSIEKRIAFLHGNLAAELESQTPEQVWDRVTKTVERGGSQVGGLAWALAKTHRTDLSRARDYLGKLVQFRSLQSLAFSCHSTTV